MARFLYLDEAGKGQEPNVIVGGPLVHSDSQTKALEQYLYHLIWKHIRPRHRRGFVFHAMEIINGGGIFQRLPDGHYGPIEYNRDQRDAIADDLAIIPTMFRVPFILTQFQALDNDQRYQDAVERSGLPPPRHLRGESHVMAYIISLVHANKWMQQHAPDEVCTVIVEDNEVSETLAEAQRLHQDPVAAAELRMSPQDYPLDRIKHDPLFEKKKQGSLLQIADFICYIYRRYYSGKTDVERWFRMLEAGRIRTVSPEEAAATG